MSSQLINLFLSEDTFDTVIIGAVFGVIAAILGLLIGEFLAKAFKSKKLSAYTVIIFIIISLQVPKIISRF